MPDDVFHGNALAKVRLKAVHSHIDQALQLTHIPFLRIRICKINDPHPRLPHIGLPDAPVSFPK